MLTRMVSFLLSVFAVRHQHRHSHEGQKFLCAAVDRGADSQRGAVTVTEQGCGKSRILSMDMWAAPEKQTEGTAMVCLQEESSVRKTSWLNPVALTRTFHQGTKGNRHRNPTNP